MNAKQKLKDIQEQKDFCNQLMIRISASIAEAKEADNISHIQYGGFGEYTYGHTVVSSDIKRLRRELSKLDKMVVKIYE